MIFDHKARKILITGQSGTGKTTFYEKFVINSEYDYKFVFDPEGEFHAKYLKEKDPLSLDQIFDLVVSEEKSGLFAYDPGTDYDCDFDIAWSEFCEMVFDLSDIMPGRKLLASDELQLVNSVSVIPDSFSRVLELGRRRGLDSCFICQSPNLAHHRLRNQVTDVIAFRLTSTPAIKCLVKDFCFDEDEIAIKNLPDYQFIERNLKTGEKIA